jgi:D-alanyl-D-alanine carboxypeptidase
MLLQGYPSQVQSALEELGISAELISARALPMHAEARELVVAELGENGREHLLIPAAAAAWKQLTAAARNGGVHLQIASAFRSVERQAEIVRRKLEEGLSIDTVLLVSAPPGFSEHHTGRAVDIDTPDCPSLNGAFAQTDAFQWLLLHAQEFGFTLSYPEGNPHGYEYEPWHWCFRGAEV